MSKQVQKVCNVISNVLVVLVVILALLLVGVRLVGLAVVNVRDNGDVADVLLLHAFLLLSIQAMPKSARR